MRHEVIDAIKGATPREIAAGIALGDHEFKRTKLPSGRVKFSIYVDDDEGATNKDDSVTGPPPRVGRGVKTPRSDLDRHGLGGEPSKVGA